MIDVGARDFYFACDECPIIEGLEHRLELAEEYGVFQFDYCSCDKVDYRFYMCGYCEDAFMRKQRTIKAGKRQGGRAYRREKTSQKRKHLFYLAEHGRGGAWFGLCGGDYDAEPTHAKPGKKSEFVRFYKKHSNRIVRRNKLKLDGTTGSYRRVFDLWWTIY